MAGMKKMLLAILGMCFLAACSGGGKKVLVMASGKVNANGNTVTLEPGTTHNEISFVPESDSVIVVSGAKTAGFTVKDPGLYILNLKNDTIVGSYLQTGTDNTPKVISQSELAVRMDSLKQLMAGTNVNEQSKNYNIPPFSIALITKNTDAQIIGPYVKVPGSFDPNQKHEIYKFFTNKEVVGTLEKLSKMISTLRVIPDSTDEKK
jgi:hypothetical protein